MKYDFNSTILRKENSKSTKHQINQVHRRHWGGGDASLFGRQKRHPKIPARLCPIVIW